MAKTVRVENHFYPEDELFTLPSLGQVKNFGEAQEVTEEQLYNYRAMGFEWPEGTEDLVLVFKDPDPVADLVDSENKDQLVKDAEAAGVEVTSNMTKEQIAQAIVDKQQADDSAIITTPAFGEGEAK